MGPADGVHKNPDPPGLGMVLDPVYFDPERPSGEPEGMAPLLQSDGSIRLDRLPGAGGGGLTRVLRASGTAIYPGTQQGLLGLHLTRVPFSIHVTYYRYFGSVPAGIKRNARLGQTFRSSTGFLARTNPRAPTKFGGAAGIEPRRPRR